MAWESGYAAFRNNPILLNDPNGDCPDCEDGNYTIQEGDTYWDLENEWGLDHGTLEQLNPGVNPKNLKIGQSIVANTDIPVNGPSTTTTTSTSVSFETQYTEQVVQRSYAAPVGLAIGTSSADGPLPFGEVIGGIIIGGYFLYDVLGPPATITTPIVVPITTTTTHEEPSQFNYVTYTKTNLATGFVYVGRTSGYGTPQQIVNARDVNHHMTSAGYGKAMVSTSLPATLPGGYASRALDPSYWAIRGSEQMQIEAYRKLGISGNAINGIGPNNSNRSKYMQEALKMLSKAMKKL